MSLSLVVPVFNEQDAIPAFLATIYAVLDPLNERFEVVFVDAGSHDNTAQIIEGRIPATDSIDKASPTLKQRTSGIMKRPEE